MGNRNFTHNHLKQLIQLHGNKCVNCGATDIQWHHVVAVCDGGTNNLGNIVPLCIRCHQLAHGSKTVRERNKTTTGRPRKELKNLAEQMELYMQAKIGTKEFKKNLHIPQSMHLTDIPAVKEHLKKLGIKSVSNNVDLVNCRNNSGNADHYRAKIVYLQ